MKLLSPIQMRCEPVSIPRYGPPKIRFKLWLLCVLPVISFEREVVETLTVAGRMTLDPVLIECDPYAEEGMIMCLGLTINELDLDGYRLFGVLPVEKRDNNQWKCLIDHAEKLS